MPLQVEAGSAISHKLRDWGQARPVFQKSQAACKVACHADIDVQAVLLLAGEQKWESAWRTLTQMNPLPGVLSRVCDRDCEMRCSRGMLDEGVNIHAIERHLSDLAIEKGWRHEPIVDTRRAEHVAVVGAGPAGLSCAYQLVRRGYNVTVFDTNTAAGGVLRELIPDFRLPKTVLDSEIQKLIDLGVQFKLATRIDGNGSVESILNDYAACYVALGKHVARKSAMFDIPVHNLMAAEAYLRRVNAQDETLPNAENIIVIGTGQAAIDAARCARRRDANVTLLNIYEKPEQAIAFDNPVSHGVVRQLALIESEGVEVLYKKGLRRIIHSGQHLSGIEIADVDDIRKNDGELDVSLFEGTERFLPAGLLIYDFGSTADTDTIEAFRNQHNRHLIIDKYEPDEQRDIGTAINHGYHAALSLIAALTGVPQEYSSGDRAVFADSKLQLHYYSRNSRKTDRVTDFTQGDFSELNHGLTADEALFEARRCLHCGDCFQCENCWHFCPDAAVVKKQWGFEFDYDYCKGCGICAQECPSGYIEMEQVAV